MKECFIGQAQDKERKVKNMEREIKLMNYRRYSRMLTLIALKKGEEGKDEYGEMLGRMYFAQIMQTAISPLSYETTQYLWNKYVKYFTRLPR